MEDNLEDNWPELKIYEEAVSVAVVDLSRTDSEHQHGLVIDWALDVLAIND